jgi:hypothetical protein
MQATTRTVAYIQTVLRHEKIEISYSRIPGDGYLFRIPGDAARHGTKAGQPFKTARAAHRGALRRIKSLR